MACPNSSAEATVRKLWPRLKEAESDTSPFAAGTSPPKEANMHWAKPELVCQVRFAEWTRDAHLRHPSFVGLRDDKRPREVVRE